MVPSIETEVVESSVLARGDGLAWQFVGEEGIVLDIEGRLLRGMNRTGWRVWELLDGDLSVGQIAEQISRDSDAPRDRVLSDLLAFARQLRQRRLVQVVA